ncbi:hypothetical protein BKA80DRAFT_280813, partial [Phyllosticta citrichinensis]
MPSWLRNGAICGQNGAFTPGLLFFPLHHPSTTRYTHGMGCSAFYPVFFRGGTSLPGFLFWITTWDQGLGRDDGVADYLTNGLEAWDRDHHHHHHTTIITTTSTITIWAEIFFCRLKFFLSLLSSSLRGGLGWASFATCVISTYHPPPPRPLWPAAGTGTVLESLDWTGPLMVCYYWLAVGWATTTRFIFVSLWVVLGGVECARWVG